MNRFNWYSKVCFYLIIGWLTFFLFLTAAQLFTGKSIASLVTIISVFFIRLEWAIIGYITLAFSNTVINVANQTIRGDMSKKYPEMKATYYAITISAANFGMMIGAIIGSLIFIILALSGTDFLIIFFIIAIFCVGIQLLSFAVFMTIDPAEYEFERHLKKSD